MRIPRRNPRVTALAALLLGLALVAAACGQKPGTHVATTGGGGGGGGTDGGFAAGEGEVVDDGSGATEGGATGGSGGAGGGAGGGGTGAAGGAAGGRTAGGATGGAAGGATSGGATGGATSGSAKVIGSNRTGAPKDKIVIGIHAPVTGAAPLPATSFEKARDLYWRHVIEIKKEKVLGRSKVEVLFKDDRYQPNTAVQACRELASQAFVLVGGGGTDQIQACGRFAETARLPYFSAGVTEATLNSLKWYFASSMTYKQQGGLLAQYVGKNFAGKKVAAVITNTPNFDDAAAGWEAGVTAQKLNYYKTLRHPKGDTSWYNTFATELKGEGVEVLYINSSPVDYIRFAQQARQQGFQPQYVGVGVTMGLNAVLGSGCPDVHGGIFFSPFPGIDWARQNLPQFFETATRFNAPADDIGVALWGNAAVFHELLKRYEAKFGTDLTREGFRALAEESTKVSSGVFPELNFAPGKHLGANQVHVLQADCNSTPVKEYKTLATFASGF
ncbi:MAG TPA: ABC transporter substrate-binding protein [Acidimicrobiales bacterium]